MDDLKGKPMVPWHKWYILRRRDIDICIYICDRYYKPSLHVSTDCLHANTQDDHANYNLLRTNNFSLIFCHLAAHNGKKKKQDAQKQKNTHKRQLGPFATSTTIILSVSEAWQHLFAKKQQQEQSKVGPVLVAPIWRIPKGMDGSAYACSSHHNPAGEIENFHHIQFFK